MIGIKDACRKILSTHPNERIHTVNEYDDIYEFVLLNKDEQISENTGLIFAPVMDKLTGKVTEGLLLGERTLNKEPLKQYTEKDIKGL